MDWLVEVPRKVDEWTLDTVITVVQKYEFEPGTFDYKGTLVLPRTEPKRDEVYSSIRRTACSMANADGGFILFGVRDRGQSVSSPDDRIVGIPLGGDLRKQFAEKITAIERPVYFEASPHPIMLPTNTDRGVFIVYIPQSLLRPHTLGSVQRDHLLSKLFLDALDKGIGLCPAAIYLVDKNDRWKTELHQDCHQDFGLGLDSFHG